MLHIFREQDAAARLLSTLDDQAVPVLNMMKPVKIHRAENVGKRRFDEMHPGKELGLALCYARIKTQFAGNHIEIFAQYLWRDDARALLCMVHDGLNRLLLFDEICRVFSVDENIGVEEGSWRPGTFRAYGTHFRGHWERCS